jgi:hypothetical protein
VVEGVSLDPTAIYDDGALYVRLGLSATTLSKARRAGRLRHTRQGRRILYLGEWVVAWLRAEGQLPPEVSHASH